MKFKDRKEILDKYKWNLDSLFRDDDEWQELYEKVALEIHNIDVFKGHLERSSSNLLYTIEKSLCVSRDIQRLYTYGRMKSDEDMRVSKYQEMAEKAQQLSVRASEKSSFIIPELLRIDINIFKDITSDEKLRVYEHYFDNIIRRRKHILDNDEEKLLAITSDLYSSSGNIFTMLNNVDLKLPMIDIGDGEKIQISQVNYQTLMESKNRDIRKSAFKGMFDAYRQYENTFTAIINGEVKKNVTISKVRKYKSALHSSLNKTNIPVSVYKNLIEAVSKNVDKMHRYVDIRKKELDLDEIHIYDLYVPMSRSKGYDVDYETAKKVLIEGLGKLGSDYIDVVKYGLENGWIDVYETPGKKSGAYSWGTYDSDPYILLNYENNLSSLFNLAHEMGHSVHSYYTRMSQPFVYGSYTIFLAEIASIVNESILINYLIENCNSIEDKKALLNHYLDQFKNIVYRQTMFAEFELKIHEIVESGDAISRFKLDKLYLDLNRKYYGEKIVLDSGIEKEWQRIPHFYRNFYVFQYATGYAAAAAITKRILNKEKNALEDYKKFLRSGSSDYSIDILKKAGIDMTTTQPVEDALELFGNLLDQYEDLCK